MKLKFKLIPGTPPVKQGLLMTSMIGSRDWCIICRAKYKSRTFAILEEGGTQ